MAPMAPRGGNTKLPASKRKYDDIEDGSNGSSNTPSKKRCGAAKRWCLTWYNFPDNWKEIFEQCPHLHKYVAGKEQGELNKGWHIQGYIEFADKQRPIEKLKWPKECSWRVAIGSAEDNYKYCTKDNDFITKGIEGPYTLELDLYPWQEKLASMVANAPDDRCIYWIFEENGNAGKTTFQKWLFLHSPNVVVISGKGADMKNSIIEYKKANNVLPRTVLINIPRCQDTGFLSWQGIEEIKDMFFYSGKYEGGMVCGKPPHVFIFANVPPDTTKLSSDRWRIWRICTDNTIVEV